MLLNSQANVPAQDVLFHIQNKQTRNLKRWKCHAEKLHAWYDEKNVCYWLSFLISYWKKKSVTTAGLIRKKLGTAQLTYYLCMMSFSCAGEHRKAQLLHFGNSLRGNHDLQVIQFQAKQISCNYIGLVHMKRWREKMNGKK
jgi:hypothetical protein